MFAPTGLFLVFQAVKGTTGFQTFANRFAKIQFAAVTAALFLCGQFCIDLLGDGLNDRNRLWDFLILKIGNITKQQSNFRISGCGADGRRARKVRSAL